MYFNTNMVRINAGMVQDTESFWGIHLFRIISMTRLYSERDVLDGFVLHVKIVYLNFNALLIL